jgi:hypothetical protein
LERNRIISRQLHFSNRVTGYWPADTRQRPIPLAPTNEAGRAWLKVLDFSLSWIYRIREHVEVQPEMSFFNWLNFTNFDSPAIRH